MPTTYTPVLDLNLPEIGASRDTWGSLLNENFTKLDGFVSRAMPIGSIIDFAGPNAPSGFLICDGRLISRTTFSALFAVIGTYWGAGDGSTTFKLPDIAGRSLVGPGTVTDQGGLTYGFSFTQLAGYIYSPIGQISLPNYALSVDFQGVHSHGGLVTWGGDHAHTTDIQGQHAHVGTYVPDHSHTGTTDTVAAHTHGYIQAQHNVPGDNVAGGAGNQIQITGQQTDPGGAHAHNFMTDGSLNLTVIVPTDGNHYHTTNTTGAHNHGITVDGNHTHAVTLGGGGVPLTVLNPFLCITKIIFAGDQASLTAFAAVADVASTTADTRAEIDALREEVAELRRLFAPPGGPRLLSAPSRGPH